VTTRVTTGLRVVQMVAGRGDPIEPVTVGAIAHEFGMAVSSMSRLCAELETAGFLDRADAYGSYRLGRGAILLSGRATAPVANAVKFALALCAQQTGETVFVAARSVGVTRVIASIESLWTLHAPADIGEVIGAKKRGGEEANGGQSSDEISAVARASDVASVVRAAELQYFESTIGEVVEVAVPISNPAGERVAVVAVRLPLNRADQNLVRVRRAVVVASRHIERRLEELHGSGRAAATSTKEELIAEPSSGDAPTALEAAARILRHLADGADSIAGTARATGLRADRTQRILESCQRAGLVWVGQDRSKFQISWTVHGWRRAANVATLVERGGPLVAETAHQTHTCAFITVLKGMRSFTVVEELELTSDGLRMAPWLGRAHPIIGSDGGPSLLMDLSADEITQLFPSRHTGHELNILLKGVRRVVRDGVLSMEAYEGAGMISINAPIRDSSGIVVAAACIAGATEYMRDNAVEFERITAELAARVSASLA
jgi:DNA-binding IclR family transcriptional regulator